MTALMLWIKSHKTTSIVFLVILALIGYWAYPTAPVSPYETAVVEKADLVQEVTVTGKVQSESTIDLAFERGGKVVSVGAQVGDRVARGDVLARLDGSDIEASLAQALANVQFEEATLAKLLRGTRPEDIKVSQVALENAKAALADTTLSLEQALDEGYTKMDDSVRNKTDKLFLNPRTTNPELNIPITDFVLSVEIVELRKKNEANLVSWMQHMMMSSVRWYSSPDAVPTMKANLSDTKTYLDKLAFAVNGLQPTSALTQTTIDGWKADISAARTAINAMTASMLAAETAWRSASSAVALAAQQLALKESGATAEEIAQEKAKIASAKAAVDTYRAQLAKLSLIAPFDGMVTKQDAKRGAIASPNVTVATLQSVGAFKIEANIPEVDITKITNDDVARITLDAYGEDLPFQGVVAQVDPAERIIDGVPTYKVTLRFTDTESKVRSGMTANVVIATDNARGVLAIPSRAVEDTMGKRTVRVVSPDGTAVVRDITTGLRASDGRIEIRSGLSEGERVVTFDKTAPL